MDFVLIYYLNSILFSDIFDFSVLSLLPAIIVLNEKVENNPQDIQVDSSGPGPEELNTVTAVIVYANAESDKSQILLDNKNKAGIYLWTHVESSKIYIGSAVNLSKRLRDYYSKEYLSNRKTSYICNALLHHGYSAFSLTILKYIDISNLSKEEIRKKILEREQHNIDSQLPRYNILQQAGSLLGFRHSEESLIKISEGNLGKIYTELTKAKMSEAKKGENHPMYGRTHLKESLEKMSIYKGTPIYVYSSDKSILINTFPSTRKAGKFLNVSKDTIIRYVKSGKVFREKWILSLENK
jgi:group I intron endonuclease